MLRAFHADRIRNEANDRTDDGRDRRALHGLQDTPRERPRYHVLPGRGKIEEFEEPKTGPHRAHLVVPLGTLLRSHSILVAPKARDHKKRRIHTRFLDFGGTIRNMR